MRRFGKTVAAAVVACLMVLTVLGCLSATPEPTPTAIPLATEQQPTIAPTRFGDPTSTPTAQVPAVAETQPTDTPEPTVPVPTPAATESAAAETSSTPTPQPRVMALGRVVSVSLRSAPSDDAPLLAQVSGSDVLWVEAQSDNGLWSLVSSADGLARAWARSEQLVLLGDPESLPSAEGEVTAPPQATIMVLALMM